MEQERMPCSTETGHKPWNKPWWNLTCIKHKDFSMSKDIIYRGKMQQWGPPLNWHSPWGHRSALIKPQTGQWLWKGCLRSWETTLEKDARIGMRRESFRTWVGSPKSQDRKKDLPPHLSQSQVGMLPNCKLGSCYLLPPSKQNSRGKGLVINEESLFKTFTAFHKNKSVRPIY